eukprot:GHUV01030865.1.p1 GENE.GHUV01030865.1~~GHUV01030865.1.p1  ORF type:complete len:509 (+),score=149.61 GHUV01030865.1:466-1992(+)
MVHAAVVTDPCAPKINFFPTADEIGEPQIVNNKTCDGDMVCNFPTVWAEANQTQYMDKLNTSIENGLLKVAFKQYGGEKPRLYFAPVTQFLEAGSDVTECAKSLLPEPSSTRKLQQAYIVTNPGKWSYNIAYDGGSPISGIKIAGKSGQLDPAKLNVDGDHCANVTVTVQGMEVAPAVAGFPSKFSSSQKVCWYRISTQAKAKFDFDMCTSKYFTVNVSNIFPLVQNLTQNGESVKVDGKQQLLFRPVIHLFGRKNRTLAGEVIKDIEYDSMNNPINFINKYLVLPTNLTSTDTLSIQLDEDQLDEGYYKLSAKVALVSQFPSLIDLEGENPIVQTDSYGEDVRGFTEALGVTVVNETSMVGVQKSKTTISQITSDKINRSIKSGEPITFFWRFAGIGEERCFHDNTEIPNCKSGLVVQARDVSHDDKEHKFRVEFTDVCGNTKDAEYTYTQEGVKAASKVDYIPVATGTTQQLPAATKAVRTSSASSAGYSALASAALLLLSFVLML